MPGPFSTGEHIWKVQYSMDSRSRVENLGDAAVVVIKTRETLGQWLLRAAAAAGCAEPSTKYGI